MDSNLTTLDVLDTAGQEEYSAMREQYMRSGDGFLLVYSMTSRDSFEEVATFYQQILRVKDVDRAPIILISNKNDLQGEREVSTREGQSLARDWDVPFFETSARLRVNVDEPFADLVREIRRQQSERHRHGSKSSQGSKRTDSTSTAEGVESLKGSRRSVKEKSTMEDYEEPKKSCCVIA